MGRGEVATLSNMVWILPTPNRCSPVLASRSLMSVSIMERNALSAWVSLAGRVVVIAHAPRGENTTRIISMRKANRREQQIYQKRLSAD